MNSPEAVRTTMNTEAEYVHWIEVEGLNGLVEGLTGVISLFRLGPRPYAYGRLARSRHLDTC